MYAPPAASARGVGQAIEDVQVEHDSNAVTARYAGLTYVI
jgi:hypothetical protein